MKHGRWGVGIIFVGLAVLGVGQLIIKKDTPSSSSSLASPSASPQASIAAIVLPHHDLVKSQRQEFLRKVQDQGLKPKTIIVVSPNHYESGSSDVQTTKKTWTITDGTIEPNKEVIDALLVAGAKEDETSFTNEHGIKLVLGDLHDTFPKSSIVPILFKMETPKATIEKIHATLNENCRDCLLVASVDFSHYQPALLANLHDDLTLRALQLQDGDLILANAEVDSPATLTLMSLWSKSRDAKRFVLSNHTNSGELAKDTDIETTTHMFGWYEKGDAATPRDEVSFFVGGDMMFGRMIAHTFLAGGLEKVFDKLGNRVFWGTDASIANLEGPISATPVPDDIRSNNLIFNFPPDTIKALQFLKLNAVSLANNHTANQSKAGLATTRELLDKAQIKWIGGPGDADTVKVGTFEGHNRTLKVIGVHTLYGTPDLSGLIKELKQDPKNRVLVFPHWGAEYIYKHGSSQESAAHAWIDAGADIVVGAHPHVIQDSELYKGKPIIYSIGNFVFDQTFSTETQQGLFIAGKFGADGLDLFALPTQATKYQPALMRGSSKQAILDKLYGPFRSQIQKSEAGTLLHFPGL
jgi:gamma-polyglutamate biosynthesis protein CapA